MAVRSTRGQFRIRVVDGTTVVSQTACYAEMSFKVGSTLVDVTVSCNTGTRKFPVRPDVSGTLSFPWDADNLGTVQSYLRPGRIVSFEVCKNPSAAVGSRIYEVITETAIADKDEQHKAMDVLRWTVSFEGGDWYPEQLLRTGLPSPFDTEPS